jgi:hypothetical protein
MSHVVYGHTSMHDHAVQFYGDDDELISTIGQFLTEGLTGAQPVVVIATPEHRAAVLTALASRFIDVDSSRRLGDLMLLDAEETLATFMVNGMPDQALFRRSVGTVLLDAARGREKTPVRAYGEMVDVLWKQGKAEAAVRVEVLWNELADSHAFSLLCGYAIGNFYKQTAKFDEVCQLHTHVIGGSVPLRF